MQGGTPENAAPDIDESGIREPLGVFAAVTPFNFPGMIPLWFLPHAVATGNCFVLKPSEQTPLTAQYIFELVDEAGFPDGVVNLVNGGPDTVNTILAHDGIAGVSFVGSTPVAKHVYETAAEHGKRVQAQGGAKNYVYVSETANLDYAASQVLSAACACAGERCLALDMAVVDESVYDEFAGLVVEKADEMTVTDGLDPETDMGALISEAHRDRVLDHIEAGVEEGATLLRDGREDEVSDREPGNFLGPSVFGDVTSEMSIAQEEIFGPVVGLMKASGIEDGIEVVNRSEFGNAASIFTDSGYEARLFRRDVVSGNIGVNVGTVAPMAFFHFGGRKASFFGDLHAQAGDAVQFYTDETVYIERWPDQRE
jgi:malonate-semialdehyde dehydrogenase (acetylating)/methylmalonate-semialdehyde dehydrogenase